MDREAWRCRRCGFDSWVGKIPWRRKWQSTPALFPGKSHGLRSLVQVTVHGVAKSRARLKDFTFTFFFYNITCVDVSPRFYPWPSLLLKYLIYPSLTQLSQEICSYVQLIHICRPNSLSVLYPKLDLLPSIFSICDWPET